MTAEQPQHVVIVGGGFAGLNAAKRLGNRQGIRVTLIDRRNHHLFQPLLYQVAMAGLSPAEIAVPIRAILRGYKNVDVRLGTVLAIDRRQRLVHADYGDLSYDYLILCCGATHGYFGNDQWEPYAPGLKTVEQAIEIRRRVLTAFEEAERMTDHDRQRELLTFVVVGGGPTGVELAGALGEITRLTLAEEFRNIDPKRTRVILLEGGPRLLAAFDEARSDAATRALEKMGVSIWTNSLVTNINEAGVTVGGETIRAKTVIWAAGVQSSALNAGLSVPLDRAGRVIVESDCSIPGDAAVFVLGDQAHFEQDGAPLPGLCPVAIQQGKHVANTILHDLARKPRRPFHYFDKGIMAAVGRSFAIVQVKRLRFSGFLAWLTWLFVHIMYLIGFKNRLLVFIQWSWSYLTYRRGARLITERDWRGDVSETLNQSPQEPLGATDHSVSDHTRSKSPPHSS